jgi:hypothetical protein
MSGREPWRDLLVRLTRGRWGRRQGWPAVPVLDRPWQDTISDERFGWRTRAANLDNSHDFVFAVDYQLCRRCRLGWVEHPYTLPDYQRRGLARAGLVRLRTEHPGLSWHTLGGHSEAPSFWAAVGVDVPGGYQPRDVCPHVTSGA